MLEYLYLRGFQPHANTRIEFGPGVTSIVGPSDVGKSSLLRALRWVCLNDISGTGLMQHGANACLVSLGVDGHMVSRERDGKGNRYLLDNETWAAVRTQLPGNIADLLRLPPVCFQGQHDSPFWLAAGAAEVGRAVNAVVDLDVVDKAMTFANSAATRAVTAENILTDEVIQGRKAVAALHWVPVCAAEWEAVLDLREAVEAIREGYNGLATQIQVTGEAVARARRLTARAKEGEGFTDALQSLETLRNTIQSISRNLTAAKAAGPAKARAAGAVALHTRAQALQSQQASVKALRTALGTLRLATDNVTSTAAALTRWEAKAAEAPTCPECKRPL